MRLAGQGERGYAMAALLVGLSVMSVVMGALLPAWSHVVTREKEAELVFRGEQYARAIGLFQRKYANTAPPTIDLLVEQRFLRKKYKDPIANDDFQPIYANQAAQAVSAPSGALRPGQAAQTSLATPTPAAGGTSPPGAAGGIIGVTSKSKERSIRLYNGRDRYNEWAFVYVQTAQRAGGPGGTGMPTMRRGGPGTPGGQPGQSGRPTGTQPGGSFGPGGSQPSRPPIVTPGGGAPFGGATQPGGARPPGA